MKSTRPGWYLLECIFLTICVFRLEEGEDVKQNEANVEALTARAFDAIMRSQDRFPPQLRSLCHCLYQTINARFPGSGLASVEKILFLRFINPAIGSALFFPVTLTTVIT